MEGHIKRNEIRKELEQIVEEVNQELEETKASDEYVLGFLLKDKLSEYNIIGSTSAFNDCISFWGVQNERIKRWWEPDHSTLRVTFKGKPFCLLIEFNVVDFDDEFAFYGCQIKSIFPDLTTDEAKNEFDWQMGGIGDIYEGDPEVLRIAWTDLFWRAGVTEEAGMELTKAYESDDMTISLLRSKNPRKYEVVARWKTTDDSYNDYVRIF